MRLLDYPRCPRCQGELPIERLYSEAPKWRGILIGDGSPRGGLLTAGNTGIVCPACGSRLRVLQGFAVLGSIVLPLLAVLVSVVLIRALLRRLSVDVDSGWAFALFLLVGYPAMAFFTSFSHRFVGLQPLEDGEHAVFPLGDPLGRDQSSRVSEESAQAQEPDVPHDKAVWYILAGVGVAVWAGILVLIGSGRVPARETLHSISGTVTHARWGCSRSGTCSVWMNLHSDLGEIEVWQEDFTVRGIPILRTGVPVTLLVAPPPASDQFWEIKSGDSVIASYQEIAHGVTSHRKRLTAFGCLVAAASIVLLGYGIRLGIRSGLWRTRADDPDPLGPT